MRKKSEINETDTALFRETIGRVKPLKHTKITAPTPPVIPKKRSQRSVATEPDLFSDYESLVPVGGDDLLEFARSGIQHKILRNLRNGKYNVEATLDLHGMIVVDARLALSRFLTMCQKSNTRHALIIHGKGLGKQKPILKNKLNHWLRQSDQVLAFCSATLRDGRSGAVYVLLKGDIT